MAPELALDPRTPIVLAPPLRGAGWLNGNGCCVAQTPHRATRLIVDGAQWRKVGTFAIDWLQLRDGRFFDGDGTRNEQWFGYGQEIVAAAGTVVAMRDGVPDQTPNEPPVGIATPRDFAGNYLLIQIARDAWAAYLHLQPGSVAVEVGDRVAVGQHLALLGNTGNSSGAHLHFQLCDGPDVLTSNSLPFVFSDYTLEGTTDARQVAAALSDPAAPPVVVTGPARHSTTRIRSSSRWRTLAARRMGRRSRLPRPFDAIDADLARRRILRRKLMASVDVHL
jgi:murein DD-endopeptidase MepM/ murein hydrolase activator NlpD